MASPAYFAVCCRDAIISKKFGIGTEILTEGIVVNIVGIIFPILALLGICLLTVQWRLIWQRDTLIDQPRSNSAKWIVIASVLTTFSILLRSTVWLTGYIPQSVSDSIAGVNIFCKILNIMVEFFSHSVCFWYIIYSVEVYLGTVNRHKWLNFFLGWLIPAGVCGLEAGIVYKRTNENECFVMKTSGRIVAYVTSLIPILLVLVLCPILLYKAAKSVMRLLPGLCGRYTTFERQIVSRVKLRFILIILTFLVCCLPKIIGSIMVNAGDKSVRYPLEVIWALMAILNSVHCLLVMLVLYGWPCPTPWRRRETYSDTSSQDHMEINRNNLNNNLSTSESDRLLS